jgi:uroporphyrinogen III methyltransferase/synthase
MADQHAHYEGRWPDICCIGPATSQAVEERGLTVSFQPELYQAEGIIEEFAALNNGDLSKLRILLPRARVARQILPEKLREMGATVDLIPIYKTVLPAASETVLKRVLADEDFDLITFTSSSTVRNFVSLAGDSTDLTSFNCAAIGPITAETARELGLRVVLQPDSATIPDFVRAIRDYLTV